MNAYKPTAVLAAAMFFRMFGVFVALPIAAVFASSLPGGDVAWLAGLAVGGYGISQAAMQMPAGKLADMFGRKPVMCAMLLVFATGGFVVADAEHAWQLAAGRVLQGAGATAAIGAAWIADTTEESQRARAMLGFGVAIALAFALSMLTAAPLADALGFADLFRLTGWLGIASAIAVALLPAPPKISHPKNKNRAINRAVMRYGVVAFVSHYALSALFFHAPLLLNEILPLSEHWHVYMPSFICALPLALLLVFRERHSAIPFIVAVLLTAVGIVCALMLDATHAHVVWWLGGAVAIFFCGFIALEALIPAQASRVAASDKRATALGFVMSMEFLGMFCGAVTTATLSIYGVFAPIIAVILLFSAAFAIIFYDKNER